MLHILSNSFIASLRRFVWTFLCSPLTFHFSSLRSVNGTCDACTSWSWARNTNLNEKWKAISWRPPCGCLALLNTCLQFPSKSLIPIVVSSCYRQRGQRPRRNVGCQGTSLLSSIASQRISFQTSPRFIMFINHHHVNPIQVWKWLRKTDIQCLRKICQDDRTTWICGNKGVFEAWTR